MRKYLLFLCFLVSAALTVSAVTRGEKVVGIRGGYTSYNESGLAGVSFQYTFSKRFRIAPNIDYAFRHDGVDGISFNINGHFPLIDQGRFNVYPLAGVSYVFMTERTTVDVEDVTTRKSVFGMNVGAGVEYMCTSSLKISLEGKFNWVKDFNAGVFVIGIGYVF